MRTLGTRRGNGPDLPPPAPLPSRGRGESTAAVPLGRFELSDRARAVLVGLLTLSYALFLSAFTVARHEAFGSGAFDLGFMDQAAWNTLRGHIMGVSIELEIANTHLGYHFDPILILVSLSYLIYSNANSLLVVQSVALALGALPASWLARRRLGSNWAAVAFAAAYLLYPGLQAANVYDMHAFALAAPLVLFCFWYIETGNMPAFAVAAVLTMATKENTPLTVAMLGLYLVYPKRRYRAGIVTFVAGVVWFLVACYAIIPALNSEGQGWLWNRFGGMGGSPFQIIGFLLTNPERLVEPAPGLSNLSYVIKLLFPLGFLSLLSPLSFAVAAPGLATNLLTTYEPMHMIETYHYVSSLVPVVVVAAIYGTERATIVAGWVGRRVRLPDWLAPSLVPKLAAVAVIVCSLGYHYYRGYTPLSPTWSWPAQTAHHAIGREVAALIPEDASVSAQSNLYPHVSQRKWIWMFPHIGDADYVFLDVASQPNSVGYNDNFHPTLRAAIERPDYGVVAARDGYVLLQRGAPRPTLPDEFYGFARARDPQPQRKIEARFGDALRLVGYDVQTGRDGQAEVTLYWQALRRLDRDYFLPVYLIDPSGQELGATLYPQPANYWYPTSRWSPGETVCVQTLMLPWDPRGRDFGLAVGVVDGSDAWAQPSRLRPVLDAAGWRTRTPGQGTLLEIATFTNDRGIVRLSPVSRGPEDRPAYQMDNRLGDVARLAGYDADVIEGDGAVRLDLTLHWDVLAQPGKGYTAFVHVLDDQNRVVAQQDSPPGGGLQPTTTWLPGDRIVDRYDIALPSGLHGAYRIEVGLYDPATGARLPASGSGAEGDAVFLGEPIAIGE